MAEGCADSPPSSNRLLTCDDPPVVAVTNPGGPAPVLLIGDHAGRAIPRALAGLGLPVEAMELHVAWDIGVSGLGRRLAAALDACFIEQRYSRLVVDCNRVPGEPGSIVTVSDGVTVPGNIGLDEAQTAARREEIYQPYQDAIAAALDVLNARVGGPPALVSLHSFTPVYQGFQRPWLTGVLHRGDSRLSAVMLELLRGELGEGAVGDNQPYSMDLIDNTVPLHADSRGLDYLELEVRQDLIADAPGQDWAADLIARLLPRAIAAGTGRL